MFRDPPPPYSPVPGQPENAQPPPFAGSTLSLSPPTRASLFSEQLSGLSGQILEQQAARSSARDLRDHETLSLLVPLFEALLESIAAINPPPTLVEATFVPEEAVDKSWACSDAESSQRGRVTKLFRVGTQSKADGRRNRSSTPCQPGSSPRSKNQPEEFDGWGRWKDEHAACVSDPDAGMWWSDEDMARRLARHLEPNRATASADTQPARPPVERSGQEGSRAGRWSLFKTAEPRPGDLTASPCEGTTAHRAARDHVGMAVKAEETTFRRQSEMGIWESKTGWALVVSVSIRLGSRSAEP
ncbi:uncharacterized protein UV8b_05981 [Ustilaginoidea virens]|uniref:Uncharacterized protein n=1 Tax=Ustilaginoidea virens TaxID=1159556 RepID=A0A063BRP7_USTVR|nr:uncharacterized protein UV8b_05981 [Ustilaginoidea virens]QUC21738.1 hypothetical protein UV8b_05981 [Ustilaginoidea virens]GAO17466.1 hypothetical protein UVI_02051950 [Ustilaginoidea virens]